MLGLMTLLSAQVFAQSTIVQLYHPPIEKVDSLPASSQMWMQFPRAFGFDEKKADGDLNRKILLSWAISADHKDTIPRFHHRITPNGGAGYWAKVINQIDVNFGNALKRRNNTILCMPNVVIRDSVEIIPGILSERRFEITYHTSIDNGLTYTPHSGSVNFPFFVNWVVITRGIFEEGGVLYLPAYASYPIYGSHWRPILLKSVNDGQTWSLHSDIVTLNSINDKYYDEVTVAVCANGDWLAVFREGQFKPLKYARSLDKGLNWSAPASLPGLPTTSQTNIDDFNESVDPFLQLMPNGIMMLSYGRPNSHMAFSYDGNGENWTYPMTTFTESPGLWSLAVKGKQSTNYLATVPLGYNRFIQYGDTGADWVYHSDDNPYTPVRHPYPNPFSIWQKSFEIVTNRQNRIDLKKKILGGWANVMTAQTTLNYADANHPETRHLGAFDGSVDYWSSAIGTGSGVLQLDLQKKYNINSVGLAMLYDKVQSATVELSEDLFTWIPVETYTNETHRNIHYKDIAPTLARYVRVTVSGSGPIGIAELELYQTASTFEANAATPTSVVHGMIPYGYALYGNTVSKHGISVRDVYGYQSNRALTLYDGNESYIAGVKKIEAASNKKTLEFRFRAVTIPTGQFISMRILGMASGSENTIFYLAVMPDGSIKANEGGGFTKVIAAANTIPRGTTSAWNLLKIEADESANLATVYLNGTLLNTCAMNQTPSAATTLTGFAFASYGTNTFGELAYFDDINFYNPDTEGPSGIAAVTTAGETQLNGKLANQNEELTGKFSIVLSPNPTSELVKLTVHHATTGLYEVHFSDMLGRRVKSMNYNSAAETDVQEIPISSLSSGIYVVTVRQGSHITQKKLIVK
jgi:hypothetical protein